MTASFARIGIVVIVGCMAVSIALIAGCRDPNAEYDRAAALNTIEAYQKVLDRYPDHPRSGEARVRLEALSWDEALASDSIESLSKFLDRFPATPHRDETNQRITRLTWSKGTAEQVATLLERGFDLNDVKKEGAAALHFAADACNTIGVSILLKKGADPSRVALDGSTPLHRASKSGCIEAVKQLVDAGATIDFAIEPGGGGKIQFMTDKSVEIETAPQRPMSMVGTPLEWAAYFNHPQIVEFLVGRGAAINRKDGCALCNAARSGSAELVRRMFELGAVLTPPSDEPRPIHYASSIAVIKLLVAKGESVTATSKYSGMPIHMAAWLGHDEVLPYLMENGAKPNDRAPWTLDYWPSPVPPTWVASLAGNLPALKILASHGGDLASKSESWGTPLHAAARGGHPATIDYLLSNGLDVDETARAFPSAIPFQTIENATALCIGAAFGHVDAVKVLVDRGADMKRECDGWNPLVHAIINRRKDVVVLLLERGVNTGSIPHRKNWNTSAEIQKILDEHLAS